MSLFGASKPTFGTPQSSAGGFSFGSTSTTSTTKPPLFGSTATSTTSSLFGSQPTTKPLFGATTSSAAPLFGSTTTSTFSQPSVGLFGVKPTTTTTSFSFSSPLQSKPSGLFGPAPGVTTSVNLPTLSTLQDVIQNTDALVKSLTAPDLFGDERDNIVAKLNQLLAACGVGSGYYKADQQPVSFTQDGPFDRFRGIGYNRRSEYKDSDGIVALTLNVAYEQISTSGQRQKLIDALNGILGNNTNIRAHVEAVRPMPGDNITEVLIYVTQKGKGRITSEELSAYFKQTTQANQLKTQLNVVDVIPRTTMNDAQLKVYLENIPTGLDPQLWRQAIKDNPDPDRLVPYPIKGFAQLRQRQQLQTSEIQLENRVVAELKRRLISVKNELAVGQNRCVAYRQKQKQLSHRLLRSLTTQLLIQRYSMAIDHNEEQLESRLEALNAALVAPNQIKSRIMNLFTILRTQSDALKNAPSQRLYLEDAEIDVLKKHFSRSQRAIETIVDIVNSNLNDLHIIAANIE